MELFSKGMTHNLLFYLLIRSSLFASHKFSSHNITSNSTLLIPHSTLFSPQGLWNVETQSVENLGAKNTSTGTVEKSRNFNIWLWIIFRCGCRGKSTFPHKFPLRLLLLPKLIYGYIYSSFFIKKGT